MMCILLHLKLCISSKLGELQPMISKVMNEKHQKAHPVHVIGPAEDKQGKGGHMVDEHLPEILNKLCYVDDCG